MAPASLVAPYSTPLNANCDTNFISNKISMVELFYVILFLLNHTMMKYFDHKMWNYGITTHQVAR